MTLRVLVCLLPAQTGGTPHISLRQQPLAVLTPQPRARRVPLPLVGNDMSLG